MRVRLAAGLASAALAVGGIGGATIVRTMEKDAPRAAADVTRVACEQFSRQGRPIFTDATVPRQQITNADPYGRIETLVEACFPGSTRGIKTRSNNAGVNGGFQGDLDTTKGKVFTVSGTDRTAVVTDQSNALMGGPQLLPQQPSSPGRTPYPSPTT